MVRKKFKIIFDKRAVSPAISSVILTAAVIVMSFIVLAWAQSRASDYSENYGEATDVEIAKLKERLTVEYVAYDSSSRNISIYLLNCGAIDDVKIQSVHIKNSTWHQTFQNLTLKFLNDASIPALDMGEEGYLTLSTTDALTTGTYYFVRIVTERGALFDSAFIA